MPDSTTPKTKPRRLSRGQVVVIFAGAMTLFVGVSAIVIDVSYYWSTTLRMQRAADAAALAGVVWLPGNVTQAVNVARAESAKNGFTNGVGPNAPTNQAGVVGTINSLSVGVNFSSHMLTSYDLSATAGGVNWNVGLNTNAPHTISDFTGVGGVRLSGAMGQAGVAHGTFVGSQAENLITTFGLSGSGNKALSGSALLTR